MLVSHRSLWLGYVTAEGTETSRNSIKDRAEETRGLIFWLFCIPFQYLNVCHDLHLFLLLFEHHQGRSKALPSLFFKFHFGSDRGDDYKSMKCHKSWNNKSKTFTFVVLMCHFMIKVPFFFFTFALHGFPLTPTSTSASVSESLFPESRTPQNKTRTL